MLTFDLLCQSKTFDKAGVNLKIDQLELKSLCNRINRIFAAYYSTIMVSRITRIRDSTLALGVLGSIDIKVEKCMIIIQLSSNTSSVLLLF